jgi:hypothetical protein
MEGGREREREREREILADQVICCARLVTVYTSVERGTFLLVCTYTHKCTPGVLLSTPGMMKGRERLLGSQIKEKSTTSILNVCWVYMLYGYGGEKTFRIYNNC